MLIHIDESAVADVASGSGTAELSHTCIENLLLAHFEGDHVISLRPDHIDALCRAPSGWSARVRRALGHIDDNYAQIAGLRNDVPWSIELGIGAIFDGVVHEIVGGTRVIRATLHAFDRLQKAACATLLGENRTDADLFVQLGLMMRALRGWEGTAMVHAPRGGGGDTTANEHQGMADEGRILLTVADTDQRYPKCPVGGTYHKLENAARGRPAYQRARSLPVRTAEGLVPLGVYREVLTSPQLRLSVDRIDQLLRCAPADVLRYAHLKDGIRRYQIEYPKTVAEGKYWNDIAKNAGRGQCNRPTCEQCMTREECGCYIVDALGGHALSDVVIWMKERKSKRRLAASFGLSLQPASELSALADEVLAWGLALAPLQT